jgi:phytoene desaturase (3,4-didehydrolycopene-forming)
VLSDTPAGGKRATGVLLASGETLSADVVIANPDLPYVFDALLPAGGAAYKAEASRVDSMDYSASVIAFNWALKAPLPGLLHHNVFLSSDYEGSWVRPCTPESMAAPRQLNFYVHNPCATDASAAPEGGASIMVLLPVGNLQEQAAAAAKAGRAPPSATDMINAGREAVLRRFAADGHGDLAALMAHEFVIAPAEWRARYNIAHGAVFGLSHGLTQLACFRPPTQTGLPAALWATTPQTEGLYFVGASTRPGNGVPLVMMGVAVVFDNIMRDAKARGLRVGGTQ